MLSKFSVTQRINKGCNKWVKFKNSFSEPVIKQVGPYNE
jgi:hypothetical protein